MSLDYASNPHSVDWKTWFKRRLFINDMTPKQAFSIGAALYETFIETYEADGLDISYGQPVTAPDIEDAQKHSPRLTKFFAILITFLGLPDRQSWFEPPQVDDPRTAIQYYGLTLKQLGKNLIGGWDSRSDISFEKKFWQYLSLPFKIFLILPLKLLAIPFKFLLNIVKLFEALPLLITKLTARGINSARFRLESSERNKVFTGFYKHLFDDEALADLKNDPTLTIQFEKDPTLLTDAQNELIPEYKLDNSPKYWLETLGLLLGIFLLGVLHYTFRIITLIGRAVTSPAKSARMAFAYGRELEGKVLGAIVGLLGAGLSLAITATLWFIALPLSISAVMTYIPAIGQAITAISQLPVLTTILSWFTQFPLITASMSVLKGALSTMGLTLSTIFGPALSSLAAFIGINISVNLMVMTSAIAIIAAPLCLTFSLVSDKFSNLCASWKNNGPITSIYKKLFNQKNSSESESDLLLVSRQHNDEIPLQPSKSAKNLVGLSQSTHVQSLKASSAPNSFAEAAKLSMLASSETVPPENRPPIDFDYTAGKYLSGHRG